MRNDHMISANGQSEQAIYYGRNNYVFNLRRVSGKCICSIARFAPATGELTMISSVERDYDPAWLEQAKSVMDGLDDAVSFNEQGLVFVDGWGRVLPENDVLRQVFMFF